MANNNPGETLQVICFEVARELGRRGQQHSCIVGSAILLKVLDLLGCPNAHPLTVGVQIWNRAYRDWLDQHGDPEGNPAEVAACNATGAIRIFVGRGPEEVDEDKWAGHLGVVVPDAFGQRHALLDLTIVQANRPNFGVVLQPMCLKVTDEFLSGQKPFIGEFNSCLFAYAALPDDHSYKESPAWTVTEGLDGAAHAVLRRLGLADG